MAKRVTDQDSGSPVGGSDRRQLIVVVGLTAVALLPFLAKPFHLDDALFMRMAEQIREAPFAPYDFDYNWSGYERPFWQFNLNPPVNGYVLAGINAVAGERETLVHLLHHFEVRARTRHRRTGAAPELGAGARGGLCMDRHVPSAPLSPHAAQALLRSDGADDSC